MLKTLRQFNPTNIHDFKEGSVYRGDIIMQADVNRDEKINHDFIVIKILGDNTSVAIDNSMVVVDIDDWRLLPERIQKYLLRNPISYFEESEYDDDEFFSENECNLLDDILLVYYFDNGELTTILDSPIVNLYEHVTNPNLL